jgi:hypothetical protein
MFAANNPELIGRIVGALIAGIFCGLIPLITGIVKRGPVHITLGVVGMVVCLGSGLLLGCLLGLPAAAVFTVIILVIPNTGARDGRFRRDYDVDHGERWKDRLARRRSRRSYPDRFDDEDQPRRSRRRDEDDEDDRPRRSRRRDEGEADDAGDTYRVKD